ncbi:MAG: hypothetical protein H0U95_12665 [Bacteroidetes bacterium]|nr:hypothetical protein [Bacteroidota bacterium]
MSIVISTNNLQHTVVTLYANTICEVELNDDYFYTIKEAIEISKTLGEFSKKSKLRAVLVAGQYSDCDAETRKFIASEEICNNIVAMAILTKSMAQDLLGNFILVYDKPSKPAKVFRSKEKAWEWILSK